MTREQIIEAMAELVWQAMESDYSWAEIKERGNYEAMWCRELADAALAAAEAAGMRFVGSDQAVVPRVLTPEMGRAIENAPVGLIEGEPHDVWQSEWTAALAAAEAGDG